MRTQRDADRSGFSRQFPLSANMTSAFMAFEARRFAHIARHAITAMDADHVGPRCATIADRRW
jgi:hypothetical protein